MPQWSHSWLVIRPHPVRHPTSRRTANPPGDAFGHHRGSRQPRGNRHQATGTPLPPGPRGLYRWQVRLPLRDHLRRLPPTLAALTATICALGIALPAVLLLWSTPEHTVRFVAVEAVSPGASPTLPSASPTPTRSVGPGASPAGALKVIDYSPAPTGFPADPDPSSTAPLEQGVHPTEQILAYDAAGGTPRAYLAPTISGVKVTMPIVARQAEWVAVILPSASRSIAWLAPGGWETVPLRDQLVVRRSDHTMTWYRAGKPQQTWSVTLGVKATPTPLGRTFILGRSRLQGAVYAGMDVMALGAIPDDINALPAGLRGAHIGIHTWYNNDTLGKDASDGCIRLSQPGQQLLLSELIPGTAVVVIN